MTTASWDSCEGLITDHCITLYRHIETKIVFGDFVLFCFLGVFTMEELRFLSILMLCICYSHLWYVFFCLFVWSTTRWSEQVPGACGYVTSTLSRYAGLSPNRTQVLAMHFKTKLTRTIPIGKYIIIITIIIIIISKNKR